MRIIAILSLALLATHSALPQQKPIPCDPLNIHEIQTGPIDNFDDLKFLKALVKDKQVVLLGESSHGVGDYYTFKSRVIRYLHQECGFEVLAMESGIADIYLEYRKVDTISARQLRNNTVFGNFQCAEILPLFDYIKQTANSKNPLYYAGFDSQNFNASFALIRKMLRSITEIPGDSLMACMEKYYKIPPLLWQEDKSPLFKLGDTISSAATAVSKWLAQYEKTLLQRFSLNDTSYIYLQRSLKNIKESVELDWATANPLSKRDSLMADNLTWLMKQQYPGKKVIVWAHNGHIDRRPAGNNPDKWLGNYVSERFGKSSYHIGLFSQYGYTYEWWTKSKKELNNTLVADIEKKADYYPISFIHFDHTKKTCGWIWKPVYGFELENGGRISFVPSQRFDAIVNFRNVTVPKYE